MGFDLDNVYIIMYINDVYGWLEVGKGELGMVCLKIFKD